MNCGTSGGRTVRQIRNYIIIISSISLFHDYFCILKPMQKRVTFRLSYYFIVFFQLRKVVFISFLKIYQRYRSVVRTGCSCPGSSSKTESCGNSCQNGGTARSSYCSCRSGFVGQCCETSKTQYVQPCQNNISMMS